MRERVSALLLCLCLAVSLEAVAARKPVEKFTTSDQAKAAALAAPKEAATAKKCIDAQAKAQSEAYGKRHALDSRISQLAHDRDQALLEMRLGFFCSKCKRSASQIEKGGYETFDGHLGTVKGVREAADPATIAEKEQEFEQQIQQLRTEQKGFLAQENAARKRGSECGQDLSDAQNRELYARAMVPVLLAQEAEAKRREEAKRQAEAKRLADEKRKEEAKQRTEAKRLADEKRKEQAKLRIAAAQSAGTDRLNEAKRKMAALQAAGSVPVTSSLGVTEAYGSDLPSSPFSGTTQTSSVEAQTSGSSMTIKLPNTPMGLTDASDGLTIDRQKPAASSGLLSTSCAPPNIDLSCPPFLPGVERVDPGIPGRGKCRGACGPDCPEGGNLTGCRHETRRHVVPAKNSCGEPVALACFYPVEVCGSHQGCRDHDDAYDKCAKDAGDDAAVAAQYCTAVFSGGTDLGRCRCWRLADAECVARYSMQQCVEWKEGRGTQDSTKVFSGPFRNATFLPVGGP